VYVVEIKELLWARLGKTCATVYQFRRVRTHVNIS